MSNILIAGGTGMVGTNLQQSFLNNGLVGTFVGRGKNNEYNLLDYQKTRNLFAETKPEVVVFASANVGGINYNINNSATLIRDNLLMGINMLDACVEFKVSNLYITSTCCAYPEILPMPMKEDDLWNGFPQISNSGYGIAKKTIMKMSQDYRAQYGLKSTCFILANLYGSHDNFNLKSSHVVPALIRKFLKAKENNNATVECWGTGTASRDLFFSSDLANILTKVVQDRFDYPEPINLGTGVEISIKDLAYLIKDLTGYHGQVVFTGEVSDGQPRRCLDVSRAKALLNWTAQTDLKTGLIKTIEWYQANKQTIIAR